MIISIVDVLSRRRSKANFDASLLGRLFNEWKVAYGFAVHGNYTFHLPLTEVHRRWEEAHEAESKFVEILGVISSLITQTQWVNTIEAKIDALEREKQLVLSHDSASNTSGIDNLQERLRALVAEAAPWNEK